MDTEEAALLINDMLDLALENSEAYLLQLETNRKTVVCTENFARKKRHKKMQKENRKIEPRKSEENVNYIFNSVIASNLTTPPATSPPVITSICSPISLLDSRSGTTITAASTPQCSECLTKMKRKSRAAHCPPLVVPLLDEEDVGKANMTASSPCSWSRRQSSSVITPLSSMYTSTSTPSSTSTHSSSTSSSSNNSASDGGGGGATGAAAGGGFTSNWTNSSKSDNKSSNNSDLDILI